MDRWLDRLQGKSEFAIRMKILSNSIKLPKISYKPNPKFRVLRVSSKYLKDYTYEDKIILAKSRIKEFLQELPKQEIVISFSGGKDSCVLRHLVHSVQDELKLEHSKLLIAAEIFHPETVKFLKSIKQADDEILPPLKSLDDIFSQDGYPIISKQLAQKISHIRNTQNHSKYMRAIFGLDGNTFGCLPLKYIHFLDKRFANYKISHKCCDYIKGNVKHDKRPVFIGTTIQESRLRRNSWLKYGCIHYEKGKPDICKPLSLMNEADIWRYIRENKLRISNIYNLGYNRSGCVCCGFGMSLEEELKRKGLLKENRFELLYRTNKMMFYKVFNDLKMWKPLADLGISLNIDDKKILSKFNRRKKEVIKWYENFDKNFNNVLNEIEKRNPKCWTKNERRWIFNKYKKGRFINYGK